MGRKTSVKNKPELVIRPVANIYLMDCFVDADTRLTLSDYHFASEEDRAYIGGFCAALKQYKGIKGLFIPWRDEKGEMHEAEVYFDDNLDAKGQEILEMILFLCRHNGLDVYIEIETPLSVDGEPIIRFMYGFFSNGEWVPYSKENAKSFVICTDEYGTPIPFPVTWRFEEFRPRIFRVLK